MKDNFDYDSIFHSYTKYRVSTFNNTMAYDNLIFKFKERVRGFNKVLKSMEIKPLSKKALEPVEIFVKEDNKKKVYKDQSQSDQEPTGSTDDQNSEKDLKKNSEPNVDIADQNDKNEKNLLNMEKSFVVLGGFTDITNALTKRGWTESQDKSFYNFLYTLKIADIPFDDLRYETIVNHFKKGGEITRKCGLLKNLRSLYFVNVCPEK